jgi:DNA-binding NarL/FixJ family response regulator
MVAHNGLCLVHVAQIQLLRGDWEAALAGARQCVERFTRGALNRLAVGEAFYCQGEAQRLRGDFAAAEEAYRQASHHGREAQPGLALLRLSQGKGDAAAAAIRRVIGETTAPLARARILPAYVEIMIATESLDLARAACGELDEISHGLGCEVVEALAAHARGALALAEGRASEALIDLRRSQATWTELAAPYEIARVREHLGHACRALGDRDTATLELEAARTTFERLAAEPDRARMAASLAGAGSAAHGLTARELEVLRRVAAGKTNRDIAAELFISEHTVARHVQNIFAKLDVSSRTAATAFAFERNLV